MNKNSKSRKAPKQGKKADKSIFAAARDQLEAFTTNRYKGKRGINNIAADIGALRLLMNTENKHIETLNTAVTVTAAAPTVFALTPPAEGSDDNQRTGRSIKIDRIDGVVEFSWNGGTGASVTVYTQVFRWFMVLWKKTISSTPFAIADFLDNDGNGQTSTISLPDTDHAQDYQILDQGLVSVQQQATNSQSQVVKDFSIPVDFHQTFQSTTAASITDNLVVFVCVGLVTSGVGGASAIVPSFRMWYVDN